MAVNSSPYLLAIESAIAGGSIALFQQRKLVAGRSGSNSVSRAEDLLQNIRNLADEAAISKNDLERIAISLGPGSYTGLRIGIASVMGLCKGLSIEYVGVPLFASLAAAFPTAEILAVPMGKADICFCRTDALYRPMITTASALAVELNQRESAAFAVHSDLLQSLSLPQGAIDMGSNLAQFIGRASFSLPASESLEPIYVQNPRFG